MLNIAVMQEYFLVFIEIIIRDIVLKVNVKSVYIHIVILENKVYLHEQGQKRWILPIKKHF